MHKCKNFDLSWALHSLDCLEANIFKTTFFCQVFAYFTPLLATENDIVRLLSEMTLGSSFLSAQKTPASIWPNFFSRPTRNGIFANKYFFFTLAVFSLNELNSYWVLLTQENASVKKPNMILKIWLQSILEDSVLYVGSFNNYVDQILHHFDPLLLSSGQT